MPRDLSDVLHYFMPELAADVDRPTRGPRVSTDPQCRDLNAYQDEPCALPIAAIPLADHDIVRASLVTAMASEIAILGGDVTILTPVTPNAESLFTLAVPDFPGSGNPRFETCPAQDLAALHTAATDLATARAAASHDHAGNGIVFVRIPPLWLRETEHPPVLFEWLLLFTSPAQDSLAETYALAAKILTENSKASVGITVYAAYGPGEGAEAFARLAHSVEERLGLSLTKYGTLIEDLDIYRAIVTGQVLGQSYPNSLAAKALRELAKLVYEHAKKSMLR